MKLWFIFECILFILNLVWAVVGILIKGPVWVVFLNSFATGILGMSILYQIISKEKE